MGLYIPDDPGTDQSTIGTPRKAGPCISFSNEPMFKLKVLIQVTININPLAYAIPISNIETYA